MTELLIFLVALLLCMVGFLLWKVWPLLARTVPTPSADPRMDAVHQQLNHFSQLAGDLQNRLGQLAQSNQSLIETSRRISEFQTKLYNPKFRGGVGETLMETILSQALPKEAVAFQYRFKKGTQVDALVRLRPDAAVAVDAKFPLGGFDRVTASQTDEERRAARKQFSSEVKKHIDDISKKYILPEEGTLDYALMYIPAENVYYETVVHDEGEPAGAALYDYALQKKVLPVSPNSFYIYLQTIAYGLQGMNIEQRAREVMAQLSGMARDFDEIAATLRTLGTHLKNLQGSYESADKLIGRFGSRMDTLKK